MKTTLIYTETARNDLKSIYNYISKELFAPFTAGSIMNRILTEVSSLKDSPELYPVYRFSPWKEEGVRYFAVKKYIVFYKYDSKTSVISVVRVMYGGRDISQQMEETTQVKEPSVYYA